MNSNQQPHQHDSESTPHIGPFSSVFIYRLLIAIAVILVLLILGALVVRKMVTRDIPPSTFAEMQRLETTTLSLPRDWHQPAEVPSVGVVEFHQNFSTQMQALRGKYGSFLNEKSPQMMMSGSMAMSPGTSPGVLKTLSEDGSLTPEQATTLSSVKADLQPIIEETSAAVRLAGYSMDTDYYLLPVSHDAAELFSKLMFITAQEQARNEQCVDAAESALLPLRLVRRPEQSNPIVHLTGIGITRMAAESLYSVAQSCGDTTVLQSVIESLNELKPGVFPGEINDWFYEELVALRYAAAYGYPVDLAPQTQANFIRQRNDLWLVPYYEWVATRFPPTDPKAQAASQRAANGKAEQANLSLVDRWTNPFYVEYMSPMEKRVYRMITGVDPVLMRHVRIAPYQPEVTARARVAKASYDLARLAIAEKLTTATDSLTSAPDTPTITAYLTPPPIDPFTSATYAYSTALTRHYSAGPDLDDDKAAIKYDPTNGTTSNGDVWLTGRW